VCKRVLSRGSERTLAGRTRGSGGLFQEEIQEVGGPEGKSDSQYRDWKRDEISLERLWCMKEGEYKRSCLGWVGSQDKGDDSQGCPVQLVRVKGPLFKLSSSPAAFTPITTLTRWLTMAHVTAQWKHLFTQLQNWANRYRRHCASARRRRHPPEHSTRSQRGWEASSQAGSTSWWAGSSCPWAEAAACRTEKTRYAFISPTVETSQGHSSGCTLEH